MQNSQDLKTVQALRETLSAGDEARAKAQRDAGKLTARQRIERFVDAGSFVELYALVSEGGEAAHRAHPQTPTSGPAQGSGPPSREDSRISQPPPSPM